MPDQNPHIAQELLSHQAFLRRLAVDLAGAEADDLVQEVWQRALERPPLHGRQLRGWLARITRNLAANRWRDDARRRSREERRASERPAEDDLEARLELRKELVGALDALGPPYRETILLRYFEGLAPREIARRQGAPVTTVKKRLQRGLAQLREALDERHDGDRSSWMSAVTAFAVPVGGATGAGALGIGGMAMGTMMKVSAAVLVAAAGVYLATRTPEVESTRTARVEPLAEDAAPEDAELLSATADSSTQDARRIPVAEEPAGTATVAPGRNVLRVLLDGVTEEGALMSTVTLTGASEQVRWPAQLQESWPCQGSTSEFDLDPFLRRVAQHGGDLRVDELVVRVDHPLHFSETVRVPMSRGVERKDDETVFEAKVPLTDVIYWPDLTLAVRDARTGAHLDDVELRFAPTAYMGLVQQPGASGPFTIVGEGLSSPIVMRGGRRAGEPEEMAAGVALSPLEGEALQPIELVQPEENARGVMMYAHAPGHAWGRLVLDVSKGSRRELFLEPGAALSLRLANVQVERYAALEKRATLFLRRIHPDGTEATVWSRELDETLDDEVMRVDALEPGDYVALVELTGSWRRIPTELGRETISVPAGEARELELRVLDPPEPPEHATLGGVVSFPRFGGEDDVRLQFYGADYRYGDPDVELSLTELQPVAATRPTWSYRIEDLPVGRYQARLLPFLKSWVIELPEGGRDDLELVIPELAEVLFETFDAETGEAAPLEAIAYRELEVVPGQVTHGGSGPWRSIESNGDPGRFRVWMAPGAMAVMPRSSLNGVEYSFHAEEFELEPGRQSFRLELTRACTLRVEFRVDGAALPHEDTLFHSLSRCFRPVGHEGRVGGMYPYSLLQASAPGPYEIDFEGVGADRFRPIPSRVVEVNAGEITEVIVELERK